MIFTKKEPSEEERRRRCSCRTGLANATTATSQRRIRDAQGG